MKEILAKRLAKLLTVKSLITIVLTAVFACLAVNRDITPNNFMTVYAVVISFYFGTQAAKKEDVTTTKEE